MFVQAIKFELMKQCYLFPSVSVYGNVWVFFCVYIALDRCVEFSDRFFVLIIMCLALSYSHVQRYCTCVDVLQSLCLCLCLCLSLCLSVREYFLYALFFLFFSRSSDSLT